MDSRKHPLIGQKFGKLTVVARHFENDKAGGAKMKCVCNCGSEEPVIVSASNLKRGNTKSCGCLQDKSDLTNKIFGSLTVLRRHPENNRQGNSRWICRCSCVGKNEVVVNSSNLKDGSTVSCGCHRRKMASRRTFKHGFSGTKEYRSWYHARSRCIDENNHRYKSYGGRGITMCEEWINDFNTFLEHIGPMPDDGKRYTVDRIKNEFGYIPGNVRWATDVEQANNKRNNIIYNIDGQNLTVAQIAIEYGIDEGTLRHRTKWLPIHEAIKPLRLTIETQYTHNGKKLPIKEWVKELDLHFPTLAARLFSGWKFKEAIQPVENTIVVFEGESKTLEWWCELLNLEKGLTYLRFLRGEKLEDIIFER